MYSFVLRILVKFLKGQDIGKLENKKANLKVALSKIISQF